MMKVVFLTSYVYSSHIKNRILEFIENGFDIKVYGFDRKNRNKPESQEFECNVLGVVEDAVYKDRITKFIREFKNVRKKEGLHDVVYYLEGLDVAMSFVPFNIRAKYIYEEEDLVHTYKSYKRILEAFDKWIIRRSSMTVLTSEGFEEYHFGKERPENVYIIPNRLQPQIKDLDCSPKTQFNVNHIRFGFVGKPRFKSVYSFIKTICAQYGSHTVDIYGGPIEEEFNDLKKYPNCHFHGYFKNPNDLPGIYKNIDLLISTYDVEIENVRYAEPNKIYEAIYFETPIIVSTGTFLSKKVKGLKIGFDVDALNEEKIVELVNSMTADSYNSILKSISAIDKSEALNINRDFFIQFRNIFG